MRHTPGPWKAEGDEFYTTAGRVYIEGPNGWKDQPIANCDWDLGLEENEANARLIAAAPEMLEAAKKLQDCTGITPNGMVVVIGGRNHDYNQAMKLLRTAIAKAEGGAA